MGLEEVFRQVGEFFIKYCNVSFEFGGVTLTVGAVLVWTILAGLLIGFVKRLVS